MVLIAATIIIGCKKNDPIEEPDPSDKLALDSLTADKHEIVIWETIYIHAHTRGDNLQFQWSTNHGTIVGGNADSVQYYACPTCVGLNTIECTVSNEFGSISDTIMINVIWD